MGNTIDSKKSNAKKCALYIRVSTDKQAKDGDSLREQQTSLEAYAKAHNLTIYGVFIDDGISGQKIERNEFTRLLEAVKGNQIDIILFTKLDRWFRNARHYLNTQAVLDEHHVSWIAIREEYYDTTTPMGRMMVNMSVNFAELEAQTDSERIKAVFKDKKSRGEIVNASIPFGYMVKDKKLVPDPETGPIAKAVFAHFLSTGSVNETTKWCKEVYGITKYYSTWHRMLQKRTYIGEHYGKPDACEPLISKEDFDAVQALLASHTPTRKHKYIFAGLTKCAACGKAIGWHPQYSPNHQKIYAFGTCTFWAREKGCDNRGMIYESTLEARMLSEVKDLIRIKIADIHEGIINVSENDRRRSVIKNKLDRLKELYLDGDITKDEYTRRKADLADQLDKLDIIDLPSQNAKITALESLVGDDVWELYKTMSVEEKQLFWKSFIKQIKVKDGKSPIYIEFL